MRLEIISRSVASPTHKTPLLFVHGMWHGAWCWDEYFLPFFASQGYSVSALSLRGHGNSEGKIRGSTIADYVRDVETVAGTFDAPPVVIGHSMGGFITQKYLETHHETPAGALLASVPPRGVWRGLGRVLRRDARVVLRAFLQWNLQPVVESPSLARWAFFSEGFSEAQLLKYHARMNEESFRMFLDLLGLNLAHPQKVKTPLLVLGAEQDTVIRPRDIRDTARAYGVEAALFPDMAHDMMLEAGWRSVATRIVEWLGRRGI
ncbi:MAG: hypothetical protein HFACDABA_00092 [Anaerolineales bacterium]|nr:hypothetical protein [Anaerolineales bacterium]